MNKAKILSVLTTTRDVTVLQEAWRAKSTGKFVWPQRLCEKFLRKYGIQATGTYYETVRHCIDTSKILDCAINQITTAHSMNRAPSKIYIGPETFHQLTGDVDATHCMSFPAQYRNMNELRLYNIEVQVVPWMDGILVV